MLCCLPLQAVLGGVQLNLPEYKVGDSQPQLEALSVFRHIPRIARGKRPSFSLFDNWTSNSAAFFNEALVEVALVKRNGVQVKRGLEL